MSGKCVQGVCECATGFTGPNCSRLSFGKSLSCGKGGLCINNKTTWGGSVIQGDDGLWHMFAAEMSNECHLVPYWLTNSFVRHAVAETLDGPFQPKDIALAPRDGTDYFDEQTVHNPSISRAPDGTYLLFYMGSKGDKTRPNCTKSLISQNLFSSLDSAPSAAAINQRVGLATSKSPYGPWKRLDNPILEPSATKSWDDEFVTNPSSYVFPNGTILLIYKGRSKENYSRMSTGVAVASHYSGPYEKKSEAPIDVPTQCEDASIYRDENGIFHTIFHCSCTYLRSWSTDGITWQKNSQTIDWCNIEYKDGTSEVLRRRERPMWILDKQGKVTHMSNGVMPSVKTHDNGRCFTMMTPLS